MSMLDLIETGAAVVIRNQKFTVGEFVPLLSAWELHHEGEVAYVIRDEVLASAIEWMWWPQAVAA
jgi:hypothetical protein